MPIPAKYVKRYEAADTMFTSMNNLFTEWREGNPEAHIISISEFINAAGNRAIVIYYADGELAPYDYTPGEMQREEIKPGAPHNKSNA